MSVRRPSARIRVQYCHDSTDEGSQEHQEQELFDSSHLASGGQTTKQSEHLVRSKPDECVGIFHSSVDNLGDIMCDVDQ